MKKLSILFLSMWCTLATAQTPVEANGQLSVVGTQLTNQYGNPIQLRGMSTHGIQWYGWGDCLTESSLDALAYDWGSDILRISMYVQEGGYETNPTGFTNQVKTLVNEASERGMYALIDFHQLSPGDPNYNTQNAITFFTEMASTFKDYNNVIYDICNEPNGVNWNTIRNYATQVIPVIQSIDNDAVVLCGTHGWSTFGVSGNGNLQDVINNPLPYSNIMYTFHFYAASHGSQYLTRLDDASDVLPVFVTEFGTQTASGDGGNNYTMSQQYIDLMAQKKISWCNWNYSDDNRTGAVWQSGTCSGGPWTVDRLKEAGVWVRDKMLNPADNFPGGGNISPTVSITSPTNGSTFTAGNNITINATANDPDGTVSSVEFFNGASSLGTDNTSPYSITISNASAGTYNITAVATDDDNASTTSSSITITVNNPAVQSPYNGTPSQIPGTIQAEEYDLGGQGVAYNDISSGNEGSSFRTDDVDIEASSQGGFNVGWVNNNEWLEYTVNVLTTGSYNIAMDLASTTSGRNFRIEMDQVNVSGTITVPNTGDWQAWQTVSTNGVSLTSGQHIMRIYMQDDDFNIDKLVFSLNDDSNVPPSVSITNPSNGASFIQGSDVTITASASDVDGTITNVEFFNGVNSIGSDATSPYSISLNNVSIGAYNITAQATDNEGAQVTSSVVTFNVSSIPNNSPTVSITSPADNSNFIEGDNISISANASDTDGAIANVQFFVDGINIGTDNNAPYNVVISNSTPGNYVITAIATDDDGAQTTSQIVNISVEEVITGTCDGIPAYAQNGGYNAGSRVESIGNVYECKPWPYSGWCNGTSWAYGPGTGAYWSDAWVLVGPCGSASKFSTVSTKNGQDVLIVPNPAENEIRLVGLNKGADVTIINSGGIIVLKATKVIDLPIDISDLKGGVYLVKIQEGSSLITLKMIK